MTPRWVRVATWLVPALVCVAVFWPGILAWFQRDDFAWLGLRLEVYTPADLWKALFAPKAQGTIRPWSERGFFMLYSKLFGLEALPYRLTVFATQVLAIFLLSRVSWRLTGSRLAALLAPLFWGVNAALGTPLSWTSSYNQVMCAAFLLGAFLLWLEYAATGNRRYYAAQFAVFLLGFGALEINIVYPGLVIAWCVLAGQPRRILNALPMAAVSTGYFFLHNLVAPKVTSGPYALHVDWRMLTTLKTYWQDAIGGRALVNFDLPAWVIAFGRISAWILTAALVLAVASAVWRKRWLALFGFAWFLSALAPVLPLPGHISDYYLAIPTIGLALAGASAVADAWTWRKSAGTAAMALTLTVYAAPAAFLGHGTAAYYCERSQEAEMLVFGVERVRQLHPKQAILLTEVSTDLFWSGINDKPFRLLDLKDVFLAPGAEDSIQQNLDLGDVTAFVFPAGQVVRLLDEGQGVVYSAGGGRLRNVTKTYQMIARTRFKAAFAQRIDAGNPLFADHLIEGWYKIDDRNRWMARRSVVVLQGPTVAGQHLTLQGYLPKEILIKGPLHLTVRVDEHVFPPVTLDQPDAEFIKDFALPAETTGKGRVRIVLELDKAVVPPGEDRELGLLFGSIGIH